MYIMQQCIEIDWLNCWTLAFPSGLVQFPIHRARSPEVLTLRCRALAAVRQAAGGSSKVGATEALDAAKLAKQAKLNARGPASHDGDVRRWSHVCFTMVRCTQHHSVASVPCTQPQVSPHVTYTHILSTCYGWKEYLFETLQDIDQVVCNDVETPIEIEVVVVGSPETLGFERSSTQNCSVI